MLNDKVRSVHDVKRELFPAHVAAHESLAQTLRLGLALCDAHSRAKLEPHQAQIEFEEITSAIAHAGAMRNAIINAHRSMTETAMLTMNVPERMIGDTCPWPAGPSGANRHAVEQQVPQRHLQAVS
jgi:hypothetical protein